MKISPIPGDNEPSGNIQTTIQARTTNQTHTHEPPVNEVAAAPVTPATGEEPLSARYADFARREKMFRSKVSAREQALKTREEALKAKEAEYATSYVPKKQIPEIFQNDPEAAMRDWGLSGDQLTHALLNQPSPQDRMIRELKSEIAELKGFHTQTKSLIEDQNKQAVDQALHQILTDVKSLVALEPSFEVIKATGSEQEVLNHIQKKFNEDKILISVEEATAHIEAELEKEILQFAQIPKVREKILAALNPPAAPGANVPKKPLQQQPLKTLANSQVSSASRPLSPRERAIALLEGKQI